jgi:hypothetical protein
MKHMHNERGLAMLVGLILAAAAVVVVVVALFNALQHRTPRSSPAPQASASATPKPTVSQAPVSARTVATSVGNITLSLPDSWTGNPVFSRQLGGHTFQLRVQVNDTDYLKGPVYGGSATILKTTQLADGTTVYVIKTADSYVTVSSCIPADGKGCALTKNGKSVLVSMNEYRQGDQYVRELDFHLDATNTAIAEFEAMVPTLQL